MHGILDLVSEILIRLDREITLTFAFSSGLLAISN
jgi:hypothetical protein